MVVGPVYRDLQACLLRGPEKPASSLKVRLTKGGTVHIIVQGGPNGRQSLKVGAKALGVDSKIQEAASHQADLTPIIALKLWGDYTLRHENRPISGKEFPGSCLAVCAGRGIVPQLLRSLVNRRWEDFDLLVREVQRIGQKLACPFDTPSAT